MTPADIIRMAREAWGDLACSMQDEPIQRFAEIVSAEKQLEIEGLRIRLLAAERGEQEAARAEDLYRQAEVLLTGDERQAVAKAVASEREVCAKVCNSMVDLRGANDDHKYMADKCADAIRARSQQPGVTS